MKRIRGKAMVRLKYNFDEVHDRKNTYSYKWDQSKTLFGAEDIVPMWVADMDFTSPPEVVRALTERAEHGIYGYTIRSQEYYDAIMGWLKRRHEWDVRQEWLTSSPGVVAALAMVVQTFTEPGDSVLIQTPVYYPFYDVIESAERVIVKNPLVLVEGKYSIDFDDLDRKLAGGVKLMFLCSPHNPVGRVWTREELQRIGDLCLKHGVLVVADEIHGDLVFPGFTHVPFGSISDAFAQNSITCIAPSKTFNLPGLQESHVIIPNDGIRRRYNHTLKSLSLHMQSYFGAVATMTAYNHGGEWLDELLVYLRGNYNALVAEVNRRAPRFRVTPLEGTYLVWLDGRDYGMNAGEWKNFMFREAGVAFSEGSTFGPEGEGFLRVNIACPRSLLTKGLDRFLSALERR